MGNRPFSGKKTVSVKSILIIMSEILVLAAEYLPKVGRWQVSVLAGLVKQLRPLFQNDATK